jgi:hypothetical protein
MSHLSGDLQPLPVPTTPWERINWDFVKGFPETTKGRDAISTYIDPITKMVHFSAVNKDDSSKDAVTN